MYLYICIQKIREERMKKNVIIKRARYIFRRRGSQSSACVPNTYARASSDKIPLPVVRYDAVLRGGEGGKEFLLYTIMCTILLRYSGKCIPADDFFFPRPLYYRYYLLFRIATESPGLQYRI